MSDANETPRSSGWDGPAWGQPVATSTRPSPAQEVQEVSEYKYNDKKMMIVSIIGLFIGGILFFRSPCTFQQSPVDSVIVVP
jgi:cytochrome c biogenesis protein CcdA